MSTRNIKVSTKNESYNVIIGLNMISELGDEIKKLGLPGKAFIIIDKALFPDPAREIQESLEKNNYETKLLNIEIDESKKNIDTVNVIYEWLESSKMERSDFIISVGGGVTGDLVGFVASTWVRGVNLIHVPSTLIAMVDSSIGGKTGYNTKNGKNLVGAFYQPKLVFQDINFLKTLPEREISAGWAELIKHSLIYDKKLFDHFYQNHTDIKNLNNLNSIEAISKSVEIKAKIVSEDINEKDQKRILLNYGHTTGHALESITNYKKLLHGEAVSLGMMVAGNISFLMGLLSDDNLQKQKNILEKYFLPTSISEELNINTIIDLTKNDKKSKSGKINWILLEDIGKPVIRNDVPEEIIIRSLKSIFV